MAKTLVKRSSHKKRVHYTWALLWSGQSDHVFVLHITFAPSRCVARSTNRMKVRLLICTYTPRHKSTNFMILLFLFSLYFWTNALFHIASTFDPLGSFSRIVKFTRLCHAFAPRPRYQAPPGNQINISPTKVRVANPWRLSGRVSETQSIRLPSLHMQFIEPGHWKLGV